jgi:CysZ protein
MSELKLNMRKRNNPAYVENCFVEAFKVLKRPGVREFLIIPLLVNFLLYSVTLGFGYYYINDLITQFIPSWLVWLSWLIWPLFFLSFFMIGFFTFTLLANLIGAPFYSQLATKTRLTVNSHASNQDNDQPVIKIILSELKRILYLLLRALPLLILFVIPGINVLAPILWILFAAWSMALEYMAYTLENKGLLFPEQRQVAKSMRIGTLCFGGLVIFGLSIPIINIIVPPTAVIAATIYFSGIKEQTG